MAEENIEVSAGCSHERLQFGHALPHLFFFRFPKFWVGRVRETRNQIGLAYLQRDALLLQIEVSRELGPASAEQWLESQYSGPERLKQPFHGYFGVQ